jgi:hypothetical protein
MSVCLAVLYARARVCVWLFSVLFFWVCVWLRTWQYPEIAATCLSGMADIECACGIGIGHGCGKTPSFFTSYPFMVY